MKKFLTIGLITMGIFASSVSVKAQAKIGYISADEIMVSMPEASKIDTALNQYQQALYQAAQDKQTAFNEAVAKFYKDSTTMSPSLKEVTRTNLQKQVQELGGADQAIQQQMQQKQQELLGPVQRRLLVAIQDVAKENGYAYVLPKESLLVAPPGDDLAPLVRRKLGLRAAQTNNSTGAPSNSAPANSAPSKVKVKSK
jgi:outer membrane protein